MNDKVIFATNVDTNQPVALDVEALIEHRMQVLAGSGAGKSHIVRSICENGYGKFQQIVIGPKVEFVSLREKFDYLHIGKVSEISKPDIELNTRYAGQLAHKILESGTNAIIEFSQSPLEQVKYVRNFIESLMTAPMNLWHPVMVLIDEIDIWAPEKGHGEAESLGAIIDLAARGRDKGFFLVAATQNLAKFNKDVAAELDIKLVGKVTLDVHQSRAAQELGIPLKEKQQLRLLGAPNYHFYAFGPGLSEEIIKLKSLPVKTTHISGYKRNKNFKPIPTPEKIKQMISTFADVPQEAEKELKTKEDMQKHIKELTVRLHHIEKQQPKSVAIDPQVLQKAKQQGFDEGVKQTAKIYKEQLNKLEIFYTKIKTRISEIKSLAGQIESKAFVTDAIDFKVTQNITESPRLPIEQSLPIKASTLTVNTESVHQNSDAVNLGLGQCERQLLIALKQQGGKATKRKLSIITCYSNSSGGFNNAISKLKTTECALVSGNELTITELGKRAVDGLDEINDSPIANVQRWINKLEKCPGAILQLLYNNSNDFHGKSNIARETGYSEGSGGFNNGISRLNSLELIDKNSDGMIRIAEEFFY